MVGVSKTYQNRSTYDHQNRRSIDLSTTAVSELAGEAKRSEGGTREEKKKRRKKHKKEEKFERERKKEKEKKLMREEREI